MKTAFEKWMLQHECKRWSEVFQRDIEKVASSEERSETAEKASWELSEYDGKIDTIESRRLIRTAHKLDIPVPSGEEFWDQSNWTGDRFINISGRTKLRDEVRQEHEQKRDVLRDVLIAFSKLISVLSLVNSCHRNNSKS